METSLGGLLKILPPVDFCCVYGSSIHPNNNDKSSMEDYILGVSNPQQWHSENLKMNRDHYSSWMVPLGGAKLITKVADRIGVGVHFNPFVSWNDKMYKYGVVHMNDLVQDVLNWERFYLSGRLQKPVHIVVDNMDIENVNLANLRAASSAALLLLPSTFTERELYAKICSLSYMGDLRMLFAEDKNKVKKIVEGQFELFRNMYNPLVEEYATKQLLSLSSCGDHQMTISQKKFALCLSSSTRSNGVVFFGSGPYTLLPKVDASSSLTYTPLIVNPVTEDGFVGDASPKYFIGVNSIKINEKPVVFDKKLLSIDGYGYGGTTISTVDPYTVLESSIYKAVVAMFVKAMPKNVKRVANVAPFGACFESKNIVSTRLGPGVPSIDLVLQSEQVSWRMFGAKSMVEAKKGVLCLGFVEAGTDIRPRFSVVIGGHQIEDNLLEFDLSASRLGFSSSLLGRSTTCANFNFTSTA